jgi:hypothetical protein
VAKASLATCQRHGGIKIEELAALGEAAVILSRIRDDETIGLQAVEAASLGSAAIRVLLEHVLDGAGTSDPHGSGDGTART